MSGDHERQRRRLVDALAQAAREENSFPPRSPRYPEAAEILSGMTRQRERLGLISRHPPVFSPQAGAVPVVAVQRGMSLEHRSRLFTVRTHLRGQGVKEASELEVYEVTLAGRLLPVEDSPG